MVPDPLLRRTPPPTGVIEVFDTIVPRFGNSVFFTATDARPNIRFNDMKRLIYIPAYWAITIWFKDKVANQDWTLEWMINFPVDYNGVPQFVSQILGAHIVDLPSKLDHNDISGKTWTADVLIRRLSNPEVEAFKLGKVVFDEEVDTNLDYSVRYYELHEDFATTYHDAMFDDLSILALNPEKPTYKEAFDNRTSPRKRRLS